MVGRRNQERTGRGSYFAAKGDTYAGGWQAGRFHGPGVFAGAYRDGIVACGEKCEGDFPRGGTKYEERGSVFLLTRHYFMYSGVPRGWGLSLITRWKTAFSRRRSRCSRLSSCSTAVDHFFPDSDALPRNS